jgi:hypothetical protein
MKKLLAFLLLVPFISAAQTLTALPALIPYKVGSKFGFVDQQMKMVIKPRFNDAWLFMEDCNLQYNEDSLLRKFGTADFASVQLRKNYIGSTKMARLFPQQLTILP